MRKAFGYSLSSSRSRSSSSRVPWLTVVLLAILLVALVVSQTKQMPPQPPASAHGFVVRSGTQLYLDQKPFRFSGPNIYWLGLAELPKVEYPSEFEVEDALATAQLMGATVVRSHTLGFSTGCSLCIEPTRGQFNETALRHVDFAIKTAAEHGIRLVLPLTDNSYYYSGGKRDFTTWRGITDEAQFYTDPTVISDFEQFISTMLNRVNSYTGVAYKDDPTIMAWETGNELDAPAPWVDTISKYIKSIDHSHLVVDGDWGHSQLTSDLPLSACDIYSIHGYPMSIADLQKYADETNKAGKAFLIGEYGWKNVTKLGEPSGDPLPAYLAAIRAIPGVAGDFFWDLYPHDDTHGFLQHNDEHNIDAFTLHYPGSDGDLRARVQQLITHAYAMRGLPVPPPAPPEAPLITEVEQNNNGNVVTWRGAAGADKYTIERASSPSGPWTVVCDRCVTDDSPPWLDAAAPRSALWYRAIGYNLDGVSGPPSDVFQFTPPAPPPPYSDAVLSDHPASYWRLAEPSGQVATDATGAIAGKYGPGVTMGQPGALTTDSNQAVELDGKQSEVTFGNNYNFEGKAPFTIEAWVYPTIIDSVFRRIISKETYDGSASPATRQGYDLAFTSPNGGGLYFSRSQGKSVDDLFYNQGLAPNTWNYVVATYNGATMSLYLNGVLVASKSSTIDLQPTPVSFTAGKRADGGDAMAGKLDEIAIYNSALPTDRIAAHYRAATYSSYPMPNIPDCPCPPQTATP